MYTHEKFSHAQLHRRQYTPQARGIILLTAHYTITETVLSGNTSQNANCPQPKRPPFLPKRPTFFPQNDNENAHMIFSIARTPHVIFFDCQNAPYHLFECPSKHYRKQVPERPRLLPKRPVLFV